MVPASPRYLVVHHYAWNLGKNDLRFDVTQIPTWVKILQRSSLAASQSLSPQKRAILRIYASAPIFVQSYLCIDLAEVILWRFNRSVVLDILLPSSPIKPPECLCGKDFIQFSERKLTVLHALSILKNCVGGGARCIMTGHHWQHRPVHLGPLMHIFGGSSEHPRQNYSSYPTKRKRAFSQMA